MVQNAVKDLCGVSEKLTDDLDADQLAAATKHIDALAYPLKPDDIRALLPKLETRGGSGKSRLIPELNALVDAVLKSAAVN